MDSNNSVYVRMMVDVLKRKEKILQRILKQTKEQEVILKQEDVDYERFQSILDEKGKQIALKLLKELAKSYKVYFVNGEHDCDEKFIQNLKDNEVNVLDYKKETIAIKNTKINLYGITNQYYSATFDLKNAFEINKEEYDILLAHISNFEEFEQFGIDLSLCGDTHGGQVRLPFLGAIINRGIWFPEIVQKGLNVETNYIKGLYSINNSYLYVSSGLGNYPISIRLFNRPEIAVIKLR